MSGYHRSRSTGFSVFCGILSVNLSTYLSIYLSIYLCIYLSIHIYIYIYLSIHLYVCTNICLSTYVVKQPIFLAIYLSVYPSIYLPIYPSTKPTLTWVQVSVNITDSRAISRMDIGIPRGIILCALLQLYVGSMPPGPDCSSYVVRVAPKVSVYRAP